MKQSTKRMLLAASLAALAAPMIAQDTAKSSAPADAKTAVHKAVPQPKEAQPKRIAHGIQSGKVSAGEAASLEKKEAGLNAEERDMREDNRGRLTTANRAKLQHQQNHVSKAIDHHQHNATVANARANSTPGQHAASLKTGQLTSGKAAHLETKETSLHREIHSDREETGGKLTPEDRGHAHQQQNKTSNQIRLKKHNARMF